MQRKKLLFIFGTRPEAIKLAPLIGAFQQESDFEVLVCATGQHDDLLKTAMEFFDLTPDFNLEVMEPGQDLFQLSGKLIAKLGPVLQQVQPDFVFVQGDTSSAYFGALAAYYAKVPILHVEAGLRTNDKFSPFPEEVYRRMISQLADYHFAPTAHAQSVLIAEGIAADKVFITGNTVIDALLLGLERLKKTRPKSLERLKSEVNFNTFQHKNKLLITLHRRENQGAILEQMLKAIIEIANWEGIHIIFTLHPNPNVMEMAKGMLSNQPNISLIPPQPYEAFIWLMDQAKLIITDSGGIQEEAHFLAKPLLVIRKNTERVEGLADTGNKLVGTNPEQLKKLVREQLQHKIESSKSAKAYGDGQAAKRIVEILGEL